MERESDKFTLWHTIDRPSEGTQHTLTYTHIHISMHAGINVYNFLLNDVSELENT